MPVAEYRAMMRLGVVPGARPGPARRVPHEAGKKNKLETRYEREILQPRLMSGEYLDVRFEPFKLRLADKTFYSFDYAAVRPDCIEIHECKGFWEDDARVKWKVAAEQFWWFRFFAVRLVKGAWEIEEYRGREGRRERVTHPRCGKYCQDHRRGKGQYSGAC